MIKGNGHLQIISYALAAVVVLFVPFYFDWVETAGHFIMQDDMRGDFYTAFLWASAIGASILFWPIPRDHKNPLIIIWLCKVFVTLVAMLYYENHYGLDSYTYFFRSQHGHFSWDAFIIGDGTNNIVNIMRLHQYILVDSYHSTKVTFALIGLIAIYFVYRAITMYIRREDPRLLYILGLYPSILFWSSILGKDPIVLFGIAVYVYGVVGWHNTGSIRYVLYIVIGIVIAALIRVWLAPIFFAPLAVLFIRHAGGPVLKGLFITSIGAAFLISVNLFMDTFRIETTQDVVTTTSNISQYWASGGSGQQIDAQLSSIWAMIAFMPVGSFSALFRPLPGEVTNPFGLVAGVENFILLLLFITAIMRTRLRELGEPLVLWAVFTVAVWALIYGFVSYQNLGSAVRFKLQILPILLPLLLLLSRPRGLPYRKQ